MTGNANSYKILNLNSPAIYINGKQVKIGDSFNESDKVTWTAKRQAMRLIDLKSNKQYLLVSHNEHEKDKSIIELISRINHLSTHAPGVPDREDDILTKLILIFDAEYNIYDFVEIETNLVLDKNHYFTITYQYGDTKISKPLRTNGSKVIIDKSIFDIDDKKLGHRDILVEISYSDFNKTYFVKDQIKLFIIPDKI